MGEMLGIDPEWLKGELAKPGRSQSGLARFMKLSSPAIVNRMAQGVRDISAREADQIRAYLGATAGNRDPDEANPPSIANTPDLPDQDTAKDYVPVEVLPTFAGLGGGGTGEGDPATALVSRSLVEQELRARPEDLLIIDVRGDSMLDPDTGKGFAHGDQLMVDRRDRNPRQPGPFALWYDDGYVVKNVEIIRAERKLRIFSNNPAYSDDKVDPAEVTIMGRPVWFARRL
jgi:phage repressor protein C with HTH and peptisase S24 domain